MARLNTYATDGAPDASDKVIGSDSTGTITKNYPLGNIASWLKSSGATAVLGQNNFTFQTVADPQVGRLPGTFSLPVIGGDGTPFDAITALKFSQQSDTGQNIADFIASTVGSRVILGQLDNLNAFGVYLLESFTQDPAAPTFYDAVLTFVGGNGTLIGGSPYGMATYSSTQTDGGAWGSITGTVTDQTDLVTYVTSERLNYPVQSPNGTSFIIVAGNDGTLAAIPPTSTAPSITTLPTISGTLNVGEILTATAGTTSGVPTPTTAFQWQRSDNGTTGWADISGATGTTYLLGSLDEDKYIRAAQTEENILGTATANSASTGQVGPAAYSYLLDEYGGATEAYSLRQLSSTYTGYAIQVRRNSDQALQDIGFDNLTKGLDVAAIESFCSGTDGFVATWYDQSGNGNDATQNNASSQPKIVSNGSVITQNGKPILKVSILNNHVHMNVLGVLIPTTPRSQFAVTYLGVQGIENRRSIMSTIDDGGTRYLFAADDGSTSNPFALNASDLYLNGLSSSTVPFGNRNDMYNDMQGQKSSFIYSSSFSINNRVRFIGWSGAGWNMYSTQEIIFYPTDERTNRANIETNINDFYNIY